jgi:hypothetical protein
MNKVTPIFFFNGTNEDRKAFKELLEARVQFELGGPIAEERTPFLLCASMRYSGLSAIREFIKKHSNDFSQSLPK